MLRLVAWASRRMNSEIAVRDEPDEGEGEHRPGRDVRRLRQALPGLHEHERRDEQEQHRVDNGREDLEAQVPERPAACRGPLREPDRQERERDAGGVREHVARVGEEREAVGDRRTDEPRRRAS